jgi:hypothetical protein
MATREFLVEAPEKNGHVPDYLVGGKNLPRRPPGYISLGDVNEPASGALYALVYNTLFRVSTGGQITSVTLKDQISAGPMAVLPPGHSRGGGNILVGGSRGSNQKGLYVIDPANGNLLSTVVEYTGSASSSFSPVGIAVYHSHSLCGEAQGRICEHIRRGDGTPPTRMPSPSCSEGTMVPRMKARGGFLTGRLAGKEYRCWID